MSRWVSGLLGLALVLGPTVPRAQSEDKQSAPEQPKTQSAPAEQIPPEEDESVKVREYSFNPLQASKEVRVGNYYFKKGSYRAAAERFREATKWNPGLPEAWLRLGEAEEKRKDAKAAREAYAKYLEVAPDAKNSTEIRKKLEHK